MSAPADPASVEGTVDMWVYPVINDKNQHTQFWDKQIAAFQAKYPKIKVKAEVFPWANRDTALQTAIAARKGPDVAYLIPDQIPKYATSIAPVDDLLSPQVKESYLPNVRESVTMNGHLMGVPVLVSANPLMCDKKAFAAIGNPPFPKTWDELLALAPRFKEAGIYATNYYGGADASLNQSFYPVLWQAGGQVFGKDGRSVAFNDQSGVDALTFVKKLADGGYVDKEQITTTPASLEQTALAQNKVACTWQNVPADVKSFWGKENIEILPPLSQKSPVGYGTVGTLSVLQGAKSKPAAALWLSWVAQPEVIKAYDVASGYYSPQKDSGGLYPDDPVQTAMEKTVPTMTVGQLNPKSRDVMGVLNPEIQAALLGKKSPKQALDDAAKVAATQLGG
ncbi:sugar ABC transporter substrate-binding protein [Amycolatopsis samaneae]